MDAPGTVPASINCHSCGAVIDLSGQDGFTHIECPQCAALSVVPLQFGNFLLLNTLGIGGVGTVYKAIDLSLNRYLALKILRPKLAANPQFTGNFSREARAAASVSHPNVAQIYSFGEQEGQYYLAMELLERGSLDDRMSHLGKLPEKEVLEIGVEIASALRAAQQRGLLHRDVKPGNILFNDEGVPKIVDFGLARATEPQGPQPSGPIWGTPYYIAPEKLLGQPEDLRSDIYSLGATLFHALAGRPPFEAATAADVVSKHATQPVFSLKTYAPQTQQVTAHVIGRMLAKNPGERYRTYDELIHDLKEAQTAVKLAESAPAAIVTESGERLSMASILSTVASLIACGVVIWFVWTNREKFFGKEAPPVTVESQPARATRSATTPSPNPEEAAPQIDFNEDAPWVKAWNVATLQLTQGRYTDALLAFDSAKTLLRTRPSARRWIDYYEGITLLAADRPGESLASFVKAVDSRAKPEVPEKVTTDNFVDTLGQIMLEALPVAKLEAELPRLPSWAAGQAYVAAGFKHMEAAEFDKAAESFRAYHKMVPEEDQRWAYNLQPLAGKLARDCDNATGTLKKIGTLEADGKLDAALKVLRAVVSKTKIASLRLILQQRENRLKQQFEERQQQTDQEKQKADAERLARETEQRRQADEETRLVQGIDPVANPFLQRYDFKTVVTKYEAAATQLHLDTARQLLQRRVAAMKLLLEFKSQLSTDFQRRPFDGATLQTRAGTSLSGTLLRATDTQLVFATPYGELLTDWSDLAPAMLVKMAESYVTIFAESEKPDVRARRYLVLTAFAKQYGLDRAASGYARQATQLSPSMQNEVAAALGKSAE